MTKNTVQYILDRTSLFGSGVKTTTLFEYECDPVSVNAEIAPFLIIASLEDHDTAFSAVGTLDDALKRIDYEIYGDSAKEDTYSKSVSFKVIDRVEKVLYRYNKVSKTLEKQNDPVPTESPRMSNIKTKIVVKEETNSDLLMVGFGAFLGSTLAILFLLSKA